MEVGGASIAAGRRGNERKEKTTSYIDGIAKELHDQKSQEFRQRLEEILDE